MYDLQFLPTLPSLLSKPNEPFIHRDISWLQFNERVLAEARQTTTPVLERMKFLSISSSNLDEFFMIRYASFGKSFGHFSKIKDNIFQLRHLMRVRRSILESVLKFVAKQTESLDLLCPELERNQIVIVRSLLESGETSNRVMTLFEKEVLPKLGAPETFCFEKLKFLSNLQMGVQLGSDHWIRIPRETPPVYFWDDGGKTYVYFLDDLILYFFSRAMPNETQTIVRLTRDSDVSINYFENDPESIPDIVRSRVSKREHGSPVRLQYHGLLREGFLARACSALNLKPMQTFPVPYTMCLHGLMQLFNHLPSHLAVSLKHPPLERKIPPFLRSSTSYFDAVSNREALLHHPYDSFETFVEWIRQACLDPFVTQIEQTVYRVDALSPIIGALKDAAKEKSIRVFIELRARFDELNNLKLAEELRKSNIDVRFGFGHLKLHAKVALITRIEKGKTKFYTHLSTGNYNSFTARQYTDFGLLTSNQEIGNDARMFFDALLMQKMPKPFKRLVVAPTYLHRKLLHLIQDEIRASRNGKIARIFVKVNALVDEKVIQSLYEASQNNVRIDLVVRSACSLIPGVKGLSENIRVFSIVDRFLEHSRIYYFESAKQIYLSSADWMPRNFFSRFELAFPVLDEKSRQYLIDKVIPAYLNDTAKSKELTPQGTWKKRSQGSGKVGEFRSQFYFEELSKNNYEGTPLSI